MEEEYDIIVSISAISVDLKRQKLTKKKIYKRVNFVVDL
jgi:hypothetical protein